MAFAVKFQTTDCPSSNGVLVSRDGEWRWIVREPEGWVWATSQGGADQGVAGDVKTWQTREAAERATLRWEKEYHPWYGKPNGIYEVVELAPTYRTTQTGWKIKNDGD